MRNSNTIRIPDIINNQSFNALNYMSSVSIDSIENNPVFRIIAAEGCENFVSYLERIGLARDPNLVVLSSQHYYYYDAEEMKNVNTVINLKELNQIKQIKSFLHSIYHILPQKSNFIGCFVDNKKINGYVLRNSASSYQLRRSFNDVENGIVSRFPFLNMLYSLMDSKTNNYMSGKSVSLLLENHGFKVMDMTELNGLTYFHSQKIPANDN